MSASSAVHWDNVYTTKPTDTVSWYQAVPRLSLDLISECAAPPATVLDVGGGASYLVDHLLDAGYRVGVLDISQEALAISRARLGTRADNVSWFVGDVTAFSSNNIWDVWHDRAVFHFLTDPAQRKAYIQALERATRPGCFVIIATFGPQGPERCSGLPVQRYSPESLATELGPLYRLVKTEWHDHKTPSGGNQQFVYCVFHRT